MQAIFPSSDPSFLLLVASVHTLCDDTKKSSCIAFGTIQRSIKIDKYQVQRTCRYGQHSVLVQTADEDPRPLLEQNVCDSQNE